MLRIYDRARVIIVELDRDLENQTADTIRCPPLLSGIIPSVSLP